MFNCLYTNQLNKKRKVYQDGFVKLVNSKVVLLDSSKQSLDSTFVRSDFTLTEGAEISFERYLVELTTNVSSMTPSDNNTSSNHNNITSTSTSTTSTVATSTTNNHSNNINSITSTTRKLSQFKKPTFKSSTTSTTTMTTISSNQLVSQNQPLSSSNSEIEQTHYSTTNNAAIRHARILVESSLHLSAELFLLTINLLAIQQQQQQQQQEQQQGEDQSSSLAPRSNADILSALFGAPQTSTISANQSAATTTDRKRNNNDNDDNDDDNDSNNKKKSKVSSRSFVSPLNNNNNDMKWSHSEITFPSRSMIDNLLRTNRFGSRSLRAPLTFESWSKYCDIWKSLIKEEINLKLADIAQSYYTHISLLGGNGSKSIPSCIHGAAQLFTVSKTGANHGRKFFSCRQCSLFVWADKITSDTSQSSTSKFRERNAIKEEAFLPNVSQLASIRKANFHLHDDVEFIQSSKKAMYVKLNGRWRAMTSSYAKDDIWIICSDATMSKTPVICVRSTFHGPARSGLLQVEMLGAMPTGWNAQQSTSCYALRATNASSEFAMMDNLSRTDEKQLPLLKVLLGQTNDGGGDTRFAVGVKRAVIDAIVDDLVLAHRLNVDQHDVLLRCANWFKATDDPPTISNEILLIHGVFGSGKSTLLVVCIMMIVRVAAASEAASSPASSPSIRVLVAAVTNVAVDRILLALLRANFLEFLRVGSVKKISKEILSKSVHRSRDDADDERNDTDAVRDLQSMLAQPSLSEARRLALTAELNAVRNGIARHRVALLSSVRVVGVTCAASVFSVLDNQTFPFVFLDECSQMPEPQSLLPVTRFNVRRLALIGDPLQLPPALHACFGAQERAQTAHSGLGRTLFNRMARIGTPVVMLRHQYRCSPQISKLSNKLFYENKLIDAAEPDQVSTIIPDLPSLVWYDCSTKESHERQTVGGSYVNDFEAKVVVQLLSMLRDCEIPPSSIGVICLYKSQADLLSSMILPTNTKTSSTTISTTNNSDTPNTMNEMMTTPDEYDDVTIQQQQQQQQQQQSTEEKDNSGNVDDEDGDDQIHIATVDAFQGAEKDVIIVSCVRTTRVGFLDSAERTNVAITRARRHLIIVGSASTLSTDANWAHIVHQCRDDGAIFQPPKLTKQFTFVNT